MEGIHEVNDNSVETLATHGLELPYVEYGQIEPAIKLLWNGEEYWYHKTLPIKGYGAVLYKYIRELEAEGHKPVLARFFSRIYIYATGVTPIGAGKPAGAD